MSIEFPSSPLRLEGVPAPGTDSRVQSFPDFDIWLKNAVFVSPNTLFFTLLSLKFRIDYFSQSLLIGQAAVLSIYYIKYVVNFTIARKT